MQVPFIDLGRIVGKVKASVLADWQGALDRCEFVGGPSVGAMEKNMEAALGVANFTACSNGTDALVVALKALGIGPNMRVAMPNMTFWAPYEAAVVCGAEPILIDMDPADLQMSYEKFVEAHERFRFDAAIFVHLFGYTSAALDTIRRFADQRDIVLIEDGAQCFGVEFQGEPVLSDALIGTMSFYPAKVVGASGDAGGIACKDIKLAEKIRSLINHGRAGHYTYDYVGFNARLGAMQAMYLIRMLEQLPDLLASRRQAERFYQDFFADYPELCRVYQAPKGVISNGYLNVMTAPHKSGDEVIKGLTHLGVSAARTYPQTLAEQVPARKALRASDLHVSEEFSKRVFNLPLFAGITPEECEYAAQSLIKVLRA